MRILIACTLSDRSEIALYRRLHALGHALLLVCHPGEPRQAALAAEGITASPLIFRHRLDLRAVRELRRRLRQFRPDVILASRNATLAVSLLARRGLPVAVVGYRGTIGHLSRWDPASWLAYLHPGLDGLWCVSEAVRVYVRGFGVPAERLATVYKGHEPAWYADIAPLSRADLGIPEGVTLLGFTGAIRPVKGVEVLLRALARLGDRPDLHLLLIGELRLAALPALAAELGLGARVHFLGYRQDALACTRACDVFVMPSLEREGLPRAVIEAMGMGLPVITTRVGGLPELVRDGIDGVTVPAGDSEALAQALALLAGDVGRRQQMGRAGAERIACDFTVEKTVEGLGALLVGAVARRRRRCGGGWEAF